MSSSHYHLSHLTPPDGHGAVFDHALGWYISDDMAHDDLDAVLRACQRRQPDVRVCVCVRVRVYVYACVRVYVCMPACPYFRL